MTNTTIKHTLLGAVVALVLAGGLAGCAAADLASPLLPGLSSGSSDAALEATPSAEPIVGDLDGDGELSSWEKEQLGLAYVTKDGQEVSIARDQPLPDVVLAEVTDSLTQITHTNDASDQSVALYAEIDVQQARIGKTIIPISYGPIDKSGNMGWAVGQPAPITRGGFESAESAVANATAWVGSKNNYYVIIVVG